MTKARSSPKHHIHSILLMAAGAVIAAALSGCMKWDYGTIEDFQTDGHGLLIGCEGNFQYSNATLSYYDPLTDELQSEVFYRANGMRLGDVMQSMVVHDGRGWLVVNNSRVVFVIDPDTFRETGRIEGFTSPRYIQFVGDHKAYVSQLWDNRIAIVDTRRLEITGYIEVPGMEAGSGSTEQMVLLDGYVYCNCWSYQNRIIKIDTATDRVVGELTVGIQPNSLVLDCNGKLWTITDGGYPESPAGYEAPALWRIDAATLTIEHQFRFKLGATLSKLQINAAGDTLYWINDDVWQMDISARRLPVKGIIASRGTRYYALTVSPYDNDIYVSDAIDYQQEGIVYRYKPNGTLTHQFYVGVNPSSFAWK